jgi:hypothetical protein
MPAGYLVFLHCSLSGTVCSKGSRSGRFDTMPRPAGNNVAVDDVEERQEWDDSYTQVENGPFVRAVI